MIVICEDCGKKYSVDPAQIKGARARVRCRACGHYIIIVKPLEGQPESPAATAAALPSETAATAKDNTAAATAGAVPPEASPAAGEGTGQPESGSAATRTGRSPLVVSGLRTSTYLVLNFALFILVLAGVFALVYLRTVPPLLRAQAELRVEALSRTLAGVVGQPMLLRNYLQVNQLAEGTARQPGVAYVTVLNSKGAMVAGLASRPERFSAEFVMQMQRSGFPPAVVAQNRLAAGQSSSSATLMIGGAQTQDFAVALSEGGGEVHVGLFTGDIDSLARESLQPLLTILAVMALVGVLSFMLLARGIARPIGRLSEIAHRISLGEMDLPITVRGSHEVNELAASLERLRLSVRLALERLRGKGH